MSVASGPFLNQLETRHFGVFYFWSHWINLRFRISKYSGNKHITPYSQEVKIKWHYTTTVAVIHAHTWLTRAFYHKTTFKGLDRNSAARKKIQTNLLISVTFSWLSVNQMWVWSHLLLMAHSFLPSLASKTWSYIRQGGLCKVFSSSCCTSQPRSDCLLGGHKSPKHRAVGSPPAIIQPPWRQPT